MLSIRCRLIKYYLIYVRLTLTLAKVCPYTRLITLEWLVIVEFVVNNKVYLVTKVLPFIANHGRELRMRANIRRKEKIEKATEFAEKMRKVQEKAGVALRKVQ